jgi:hypothetical protein
LLASIFGKVTASLGRTYVFSGLLPAAGLLLAISFYLESIPTLTEAGQQLLTSPDSWKSWAWYGALWLATGFLFYVLRAPLFSLFQVAPSGPVGRWLLFRRIAKREQLQRNLDRSNWQATAINWLTALELNRNKIGDIPFWLLRSASLPDEAIAASRAGRQALTDVVMTAGDALNLTVARSDAITAGISALYGLAKFQRSPEIEHAVAEEIAAWNRAFDSKPAQTIIMFVEQDCRRKIARAFSDRQRFGWGPYVFPTKLGNLISALDDYSLTRYRIDTATMWDRLWWVLPKEAKTEVNNARLVLETLLNILVAVFLVIATVIGVHVRSCGLSLVFVGPCDAMRTLAFVAAGALFNVFAYRSATFAMELLAVKMTSLIDMYRLPTLVKLGFSPKTVGEELAISGSLKGLFTQAAALEAAQGLLVPNKGESKEEKPSESKDEKKDHEDGDREDESTGEESEAGEKPDRADDDE